VTPPRHRHHEGHEGHEVSNLKKQSGAFPRVVTFVTFVNFLNFLNFVNMARYSYRNARIGSMRLARRAGINPAAAETAASTAIVPAAIQGSFGCTPYS